MSALAQFIMKGRSQAILVLASFTILSWLLSLASLLAAAALALPTLRRGIKDGAIVALAALPIVALAGQMLMGSAVQAGGFALVIWVPVLLVAWVLRSTASLSTALLTVMGLGVVSVIGFYLVVDDVAGFWKEQFQVILKPILEQQMQGANDAPIAVTLELFSRYATGSIAAGSVISVILSIFLARWWQAGLYNPGGFRTEFLSLAFNRWAALGLIGMIALIGLTGGEFGVFIANLVLPVFVGFMTSGFAVVHALCGAHPSGRFWLIGLYIALLFVTPLILLIAFVGISDSWFDWRRRFAARKA
ncbi:MAG: hypothetical protein RLZ25_723 [Pseudomonadota bacterium]|jgi:hypothetical protein